MKDRPGVYSLGNIPEIDLNRPPEESSQSIPGLQRLDKFGQSMLTLQTESREEQGIDGNFILGEN